MSLYLTFEFFFNSCYNSDYIEYGDIIIPIF